MTFLLNSPNPSTLSYLITQNLFFEGSFIDLGKSVHSSNITKFETKPNIPHPRTKVEFYKFLTGSRKKLEILNQKLLSEPTYWSRWDPTSKDVCIMLLNNASISSRGLNFH